MKDLSDLVAEVVALNGGEMVTKVRLQKTFHLLQAYRLFDGVEDLEFEYHYYGPYSSDLARAADDAVAEEKLSTKVRRGYHKEPYTVYLSTDDTPPSSMAERSKKIRTALEILKAHSGLVLEVAATIRFLQMHGSRNDAIDETRRRKPVKATEARVRRAEALLNELESVASV